MERRMNTHLILGLAMGIIGLVVWYVSFSLSGDTTDARIAEYLARSRYDFSSALKRYEQSFSREQTGEANALMLQLAEEQKQYVAHHVSWEELFRTFVPRITILAFIEILAGFFLRQYRVGAEDLKYFLDLERRSNARRVAYAIYRRPHLSEFEVKFATDLLGETATTRLAPGESTTTLETLKLEKNVALETLTAITEQIKSVTGITRTKGEAKAAKAD